MATPHRRPYQEQELIASGFASMATGANMAKKMTTKPTSKSQHKGKGQRLSLYPLDPETALLAAARTGRVTSAKLKQPNRERKRDATPD
jgi:hypothetical protein